MSELPGLPPVPRPTRPLPAGGLERALREGRRRRHRAIAGVAVGAAVVVAAVPVTTSLLNRSGDRLTTASPGASETPRPTASPRPTGPLSPAAFREDTDVSAPGGGDCAPGRDGGDTLCRYVGGTAEASTLVPGETATVVLGYCLPRDASGDHVFSFDSGQEKDVAVTTADGAEVFRFSPTVRYVDGAHERTLRRGQCIEWTGRWGLVTTDGAPVAPGEYVVSMTVRADEEISSNSALEVVPRLPETLRVPLVVAERR